jgi:hypothetical protein
VTLKSLHAWCDYHHSCDQTLDPMVDPNFDLMVWTVRLDDLVCWLKLKDGIPFDGVPKFLSLKEWKAWDKLFQTALRHVRNSISP